MQFVDWLLLYVIASVVRHFYPSDSAVQPSCSYFLTINTWTDQQVCPSVYCFNSLLSLIKYT